VANNETTIGLLGIPEQQKNNSIELRPKEIQKWIDALPRADVGETAKLVYKNLYQLNRTKMSDADRYKIMAHYWEPIEFLAESLKNHFLGLPFPLIVKKQQVALLAREIQAEMAVAYKIVAEGNLTGRRLSLIPSSRIDNKTLKTTIYYAMQYLGSVLLKSYQIYVPIPDDIWKQINRLYIHACQNGFANDALASVKNKYITKPSIENLYKKILLLSLANPYRLSQGDIEKVNSFLEQWSSYTVLNTIDDSEKQVGMFSIDLSSDDAPGFFIPSENPNALIRLLETDKLITTIKDDIKHYSSYISSHGGNKNKVISKKVLKLLQRTWDGIAKRNSSRSRKKSKILATFGLSGTHHTIYHTMKVPLEQDQQQKQETATSTTPNDVWPPKGKASSRTIESEKVISFSELNLVEPLYEKKAQLRHAPVFGIALHQSSKKDIWTPRYNSHSVDYDNLLSSYSTRFGEFSFINESMTETHEKHLCGSLNESPGGYRILWQPSANKNKNINALVGELIGIREYRDDKTQQWGVGVIRWMKHTGTKKQLELGVQKLAPHAISASVQIVKKIKTQGPFVRALILPEIKSINQSMTLIAPNTYSVGNTLKLSIFNDKIFIKLTRLVEMTGAFSHFQFSTLSQKELTEHDDEKSNLNFDLVWSSIK